jgi:ABC-type sugar transport system ATPase subunit
MSDVAAAPVLEVRGISKAYGHVQALSSVDFRVLPYEIVALVGDNGAGKSTLVKILSGVVQADAGEVLRHGNPIAIANPVDARAAGIATVFQDLALVEVLDVPRNVFLGREPRRFGIVEARRMRNESRRLMEALGIRLPSIGAQIAMLSGGQRQSVAIARAVHQGGQIFVLDEPTAALGVRESAQVRGIIEDLRAKGASVVLVSHNLELLFGLVDRFHVLRLGRTAGVVDADRASRDEVVGLITGASQAA